MKKKRFFLLLSLTVISFNLSLAQTKTLDIKKNKTQAIWLKSNSKNSFSFSIIGHKSFNFSLNSPEKDLGYYIKIYKKNPNDTVKYRNQQTKDQESFIDDDEIEIYPLNFIDFNQKSSWNYLLDSGQYSFEINIQRKFDYKSKSNSSYPKLDDSVKCNFRAELLPYFPPRNIDPFYLWYNNKHLPALYNFMGYFDLTRKNQFLPSNDIMSIRKTAKDLKDLTGEQKKYIIYLSPAKKSYYDFGDSYFNQDEVWLKIISKISSTIHKPMENIFIYFPIPCTIKAVYFSKGRIENYNDENCSGSDEDNDDHQTKYILPEKLKAIQSMLTNCEEIDISDIMKSRRFKQERLTEIIDTFVSAYYKAKKARLTPQYDKWTYNVVIRNLKSEVMDGGKYWELITIQVVPSFMGEKNGRLIVTVEADISAGGKTYPPDTSFTTPVEEGVNCSYSKTIGTQILKYLSKKYENE